MGGTSPSYMGYEDKYAEEAAEELVTVVSLWFRWAIRLTEIAALAWVVRRMIPAKPKRKPHIYAQSARATIEQLR